MYYMKSPELPVYIIIGKRFNFFTTPKSRETNALPELSYEENNRLIDEAKQRMEANLTTQ